MGRFVDSTDGNTEETALTIANTDIKLWKTGATTLASKNSGGATHMANGEYYCVLDATDSDTIGPMKVTVHVAGALAVQVWCCVLDEAVYDAMFGTAAPLVAGSNAATTFASLTCTGKLLVSDGFEINAATADRHGLSITGNGAGNGAVITSGSGATSSGLRVIAASTNGNGIHSTGSGTADGFHGEGGPTGYGAHFVGGSTSGAGFRVEAAAGNSNGMELVGKGTGDGINSTGGTTGRGANLIGGSTSGAGFRCVGSAGNANGFEAVGQGSGDGMHTTGGATGDGLEAVGGSTSGDGIKGTVTSGAPIRGDQVGNITGSLSGSAGSVTGAVGSVAAGGITSASFAAGAIDATAIATDAIGANELAASAIAEIAGGVWDLATAGHTTSGTFGAAMVAAGAAGDPWSTSLPAAYGAGTAGFIVGTNIDALISSRTKPADTQAAVTLVTTCTNLTNAPTAGDLTAAMKASVNAEVVDALAVDTYAEPASVPAATSSLKDKLGWLFTLLRNKRTQTATTETLRNDGDSGNIGTSAKSDDGSTLTRGEWA